jgi:hypothetical protein
MKEFKICVGPTKDRMTEVLLSTLKDDSVPETFALRYTNKAGVPFPSRYIKIIPISCVDIPASPVPGVLNAARLHSAYSHSFHISVWFVSISGFCDESYVRAIELQHEVVCPTKYCFLWKI